MATKKPEPQTESKADAFKRLAKKRMPPALKRLDLIQNLTGPGYESTPAQQEQIRSVLQKKLDEIMASFAGTKDKGLSFDFDDEPDNGEVE